MCNYGSNKRQHKGTVYFKDPTSKGRGGEGTWGAKMIWNPELLHCDEETSAMVQCFLAHIMYMVLTLWWVRSLPPYMGAEVPIWKFCRTRTRLRTTVIRKSTMVDESNATDLLQDNWPRGRLYQWDTWALCMLSAVFELLRYWGWTTAILPTFPPDCCVEDWGSGKLPDIHDFTTTAVIRCILWASKQSRIDFGWEPIFQRKPSISNAAIATVSSVVFKIWIFMYTVIATRKLAKQTKAERCFGNQ